VGVKVKVGRGVSEGGTVGVAVGEGVGERVTVAEGSGLAVQIGSIVGVGGARRLNPPQLMSKRARLDIKKKAFVIERPLALP
jgi:hypothetical protein